MNTDPRVSIKEASQKLGLPQQTLRVFLQNGKFKEFAEATKINNSRHWTYYINRNRLEDYLKIKKESNQLVN
ncbi:helix-turn-helix domain-containing protein [Fusobacterium russii]|uniref:helix-turn-helix domain-containing protein n=1 Tax=Fusobacterium russii TaxID=854 RepID=UPI0003A7B192|nr:helix-turn-helix domain-containing protein [Fusobacterium russii]